ncbi:unnamed protein product [Merluccius merluccius]
MSESDVEEEIHPASPQDRNDLKTCATEEDLATLKTSCGDWVSGCGVPTFFNATLLELPQVVERMVANFIFHR